jgi:predicted ATPase/DNA-binding SARP family transcriptional activator
LEYRLLGPLEVRDADRSLALAGAKQRDLLALLLVNANHLVSRDRLIDELWGDRPPATALESLQVYVSRLRKLLPAETLLTLPTGYLLKVGAEELDVLRFERLHTEGRKALADGDTERAAVLLHDALALWRGRALADFASKPFAQAEIDRLEDLRLATVEERVEADLALGFHAEVVGRLRALIAKSPHRERLRAQLMLALYRSGRQAEALEAYQDARRALVDELGIEPSAQLQRLERQILTHDPELESPPRSRPGTATLFSSSLPFQSTPLVGRERELDELVRLVRREQLRLVTVTGPGGVGKTRLALQVAAEVLEEFPDGITWVPLQSLRDHELVLPAIARAVGAEDGLETHIGERRMLLLLDNMEQLVRAAPQLAELLTQTPNLRLLVTSREPLHLAGEQEYLVGPLDEPDAVALFAQRARAVTTSFEADEAVAEICRRLDCLPLAIELAAARVKVLPTESLVQRLEKRLPLLTSGRRDAPARHQTLRATIVWSYELLTGEEQALFAGLGVFAGGCTLEAAQEVLDAELDALASLVDKSLLRHQGGRYSMLETIHEYALEQSERSGDHHQEISARHAGYFVTLCERITEQLRSDDHPDARRLTETLAAEHDNVSAALRWAVDRGDRELALRLAVVVRWIAAARTLAEARSAFEAAFAVDGAAAPAVEARAFVEAGMVANEEGDPEAAVALGERALALYRSVGDAVMVSASLRFLGEWLGAAGRPETARRSLRRAIALSRRMELGNQAHAEAVHLLGELELSEGCFERAGRLLAESLNLHAIAGRPASSTCHGLGDVRLEQGYLAEANRLYRESLAQTWSTGYVYGTAHCLGGLAAAAAAAGDVETAGRLWSAVTQYEEKRGGRLNRSNRERYERRLEALDAATLATAVEHGRTMSFDDAVEYALSRRDRDR